MPSLQNYRYISSVKTNNSKTIGEWHKSNSDFAMEYTWNNDIQSKICYIYDYEHDDQPDKNKYITHEDTTKTKIDAKFIVSSYGSIDKDQVAYHLMFKSSEKINFNDDDEMYYFEKKYRKKFDTIYPISLYVDIPDEKGIYVKWMIVDFEEGNQFTKYTILPCDYKLEWIDIENNNKRIKRRMWCCTRSANSYTSGLWIDRYVNTPDDIKKLLLPLNDVTKSFGHIINNNENQRLILSAKTDHPLTWKVSKIENTKPIGIIRVTLKEDVFDPHTDYIEKDEDGYIIGMWANYFDSQLEPIEPEENIPEPKLYTHCIMSTPNKNSLKNGSSRYKKLVNTYLDENEIDVSSQYTERTKQYTFKIDGVDVSDYVEYEEQTDKNVVNIKFNNSDYIGKILEIKSLVDYIFGTIEVEIL